MPPVLNVTPVFFVIILSQLKLIIEIGEKIGG